jgi:hypothetical protein
MLGFYPIAGAPLAAGQNADPAVASQTLTLTPNSVSLSTGNIVPLTSQVLNLSQNSVLISDDDVIEVAGQPLFLTLNSVALSTGVDATLASQSLTLTENSVSIEVQPPIFDSQTATFTLNSVALVTDHNVTLASQTITSTANSLSFSASVNIFLTPVGEVLYGDNWAIAATPIGSLPEASPYIAYGMRLSENSTSLSAGVTVTAESQSMLLTQRSVSLITDQTIVVGSQTIYTTLNELRLWKIIPTVQPGTCPNHCDGLWTEIAFDQFVSGDDFAIATQPLCALPQPLPPIRKFPGSTWGNVTTSTSTSWKNVQT